MDRRTNGRAGQPETLAEYRERQARQWMERNAPRLRREFWERKAAEAGQP